MKIIRVEGVRQQARKINEFSYYSLSCDINENAKQEA
jgi:hypothetical protein